MRSELEELLPLDKFDAAKLDKLEQMGFPAIEPLVPALLAWLQDGNWPVAKRLSPLLASIGSPIAPCVRQVLSGDDGLWKYWVLCMVVKASVELRRDLKEDIERIASSPTRDERAEEVDLYARDLLAGVE